MFGNWLGRGNEEPEPEKPAREQPAPGQTNVRARPLAVPDAVSLPPSVQLSEGYRVYRHDRTVDRKDRLPHVWWERAGHQTSITRELQLRAAVSRERLMDVLGGMLWTLSARSQGNPGGRLLNLWLGRNAPETGAQKYVCGEIELPVLRSAMEEFRRTILEDGHFSFQAQREGTNGTEVRLERHRTILVWSDDGLGPYQDVLKEHGIPFMPDIVFAGDDSTGGRLRSELDHGDQFTHFMNAIHAEPDDDYKDGDEEKRWRTGED